VKGSERFRRTAATGQAWASQWRKGVAKALACAAGQAGDAEAHEHIWQAYEQELERGLHPLPRRRLAVYGSAQDHGDRNALTRSFTLDNRFSETEREGDAQEPMRLLA